MDNAENKSQLIIYQTEDGQTKLEVRMEEETIWLTQAAMAELFQTTIANINIHIKSIYTEGELRPDATIKENLIVRKEGSRDVKRSVMFYCLPIRHIWQDGSGADFRTGRRVKTQHGTYRMERRQGTPV